jgi:DNA-binding NarL/FixJ family response regulator
LILSPADGFEIVGEAADGAAALDLVDCLKPDVVLMDIRMKGMDGVEATRQLRMRKNSPPVLVLTTFDDDEVLSASLRAGDAGFILKDAPSADIIRSTRVVAAGGAWLDPSITGRVLATYRAGVPPANSLETRRRLADLTARELDVLCLVGRGSNNDEIAHQLVIGEATVKSHIAHILDKLGLRDRPAMIVFAFDHGLVQPSS